ncbi:MAG: hypothetical protein M1531_10110 [Chloroflexi bacterium]|nr:hypothetical protein [Chloroflexota bacterium]
MGLIASLAEVLTARIFVLGVIAATALAACQTTPVTVPASVTATPVRPAPSPTATPLPTPSPTAAPSPTPSPVVYSQKYEITEADNGKTFVYPITSRFGIIPDQRKYPRESLSIKCSQNGVLGSISNIPSVPPPLYAVRYEGVMPGKCALADDDFRVIVEIVDRPAPRPAGSPTSP